jgi:DNA-binding MarR family transcriptional regulator
MKAKARGSERGSEGRFAYEGLDRVIHERARLSVLTSLITNPKGVSFGDLKELCSLTDGNLSRHLRVLEEARMVEIAKSTDHNRPLTVCRITTTGRKRYIEYLATLEQVVRDAAKGAQVESAADLVRNLTPSRA